LAHVDADLRDDDLGGALVNPGDRVEQVDLVRERGDHLIDAGREVLDGLVDVVDVGQDVADHEAVVLGDEVALERLFELCQLGPQATSCEIRQRLGIVVAGDELVEHRARGDPEGLGRHAGELASVLEHLVESLNLTSALFDLGLAISGQVTQRADRLGGTKLGRTNPCSTSWQIHAESARRSFCRARVADAGR
jgi:hypothetical protein